MSLRMADGYDVLEDAAGMALRWSLLEAGPNPPWPDYIRPPDVSEEDAEKAIDMLFNPSFNRIVSTATIAGNPNLFSPPLQQHGCALCVNPWGVVAHFPKIVVRCGCILGEICLLNHLRIQWTAAHDLIKAMQVPPADLHILFTCPRCDGEIFPLDSYLREQSAAHIHPFDESRFFTRLEPHYIDKIWSTFWFRNFNALVKVNAPLFQRMIDQEISWFWQAIEEEGPTGEWHSLQNYEIFTQNVAKNALYVVFGNTDGITERLRAYFPLLQHFIYQRSWNVLYGWPFGDNITRLPPAGTPSVVARFVTRLICRTLVRARINQKIAF